MSKKLSSNCELWEAYNNNNVGKFRRLIVSGSKFDHLNKHKISLVEHILVDHSDMDKNLIFFDEIFTDDVDLKSFNNHRIFLSMALYNLSPRSIYYVKKLLKLNTCVNSFGVSDNSYENGIKYNPPIFECINRLEASKKLDEFDIILNHNPDLEYCNEYGETIINYLIYNNHLLNFNNEHHVDYCDFYSLIDKLIKKGADPSQRNYNDGVNSLHMLCHQCLISKECAGLFDLFLKNGCDVNSLDFRGSTGLTHAVYFGNTTAVEILIKNGADVNIASRSGRTPIIYAAGWGHLSSFDILLDNNARLTDISSDGEISLGGENILHFMLEKKSYNENFYIKILERNPELLLMKNKTGNTPIDLAKQIENKEIKTTLVSLMEGVIS